ncbi:MAG: glycosyl hydrolase family 16, partial [Bacteroidota bacterium]
NTGNPLGDDKDLRTTLTGFQTGVWKSFDIPLNGAIQNQKSKLGAIILTGGPNFMLDNIYFYK